MSAVEIGAKVGFIFGYSSVSLFLSWAVLRCLRGILPRYADVLAACVIVWFARSLVFSEGRVAGIIFYAIPQFVCLILLSFNEFIRARKQAKTSAQTSARPEPERGDWSVMEGAYLSAPPVVETLPPPRSPLPAEKPAKTWNVLANHWRGYYSLANSYWVVGIIATIPVIIIVFATVVILALDTVFSPSLLFCLALCFWLAIFVITIWYDVGVWRSANRNILERTAIGKKPVWAGLAKASIVISVFWSAVTFGDSAFPQLKETYRMAFEGDPRIPDYGLRIMRDGTEVEITGGFKHGLTDDLLTLMKASPRINTIHLNSVGGRVGEGLRLNKVIRDAGLNTYVSDGCASACTIAFAGGVKRWMAPGAKLGFHEPAFPGFSDIEVQAANGVQKEALVRSGIDPAFVEKALATPNADLWVPDLVELKAAGVVTDVSDGSQFAVSGFGGLASKEAFAGFMVNDSEILAWQKRAQPEAFDDAVDDYYKDYMDGVTDDDLMETLDYWEYRAIIRNIKTSGDDDAVLDLGRLFVEELKLLRAEDAQRCARFGFKGGAVFRMQYDFDSGILDRYRDIGFRVVAEHDPRSAPDKEAVAPLLANILARMRGTYPADQVALLGEGEPKRAEASGYCAAVIGFYETVLKAPHAEAATLLRAQMGAELDLPPPVSPPPG